MSVLVNVVSDVRACISNL